MLSRKSSIPLAVTAITILAVLYTARIGAWYGLDEPYYPSDPHRSHHAPQGAFEEPPPSPPPGLLPPPTNAPTDPACEGFPDTSNVLLVMKTGASEAFARVPTHLMTTLRCLPDFLIFSDMDQNIAGQQIHDSLSTVLPEAQEGNQDFDLYRRQKWCVVNQDSCNKLGNPADEGWALDKYKNIHIAEKTYAMRPGYDWYLFIDADTYVLWPNLMQWLKTLDPAEKLYLGSVTVINNFNFAHGGSGYIVSKAAMEEFVGKHPGVGNEYDVRAKNECCGDYLFALALKAKTEVAVQQMWPTINGEKPSTLPFGPTHWCHPIVTMHHMNAEELNTFWQFERRHLLQSTTTIITHQHGQSTKTRSPPPPSPPPPRPLLMKDIYTAYVAPYLNASRDDWDNLADNRFYLDPARNSSWEDWKLQRSKKPAELNEHERMAHLSFEHCRAACKSLGGDECFRFRYEDGACSIGDAFVLGKPVKKPDGEMVGVKSGWMVERIQAWIQRQGASCDKVKWPEVKG
ncbi:glycosyltransferase family 31 protein [Parathielavia appendiculata]|uniref:N-acetylgalactosaminide beta-1,3-galactosyltransferase n=1 Tax=Parathielavia appendiculata TaxID=2587402 RepID=A0AAN6TUF6_9PEZI|nr:glycosyltransferase family 31 protein [Parathielavia appendiculata]